MRGFLILFLLLLPFSLRAEEADFTCPKKGGLKPAEATKLLEAAQAAYNKVTTLEAEFTQDSYLSALETSEMSSGMLYFSKPGKMKWKYEKPEDQIFLILDQTLWFYQAVDKQVVVDKFEKFLISDLPVAFILGMGDLSKSFDIEKACRIEAGILFNLIPKKKRENADDRLNRFNLVIDPETHLPAGAQVKDIASNVNAFYLNNVTINEDIPATEFLPDFPDGTDVDDRRKE